MKNLITLTVSCLLSLITFTSCNKELVSTSFSPSTKAYHDYQPQKNHSYSVPNSGLTVQNKKNLPSEENKKNSTSKQQNRVKTTSISPIKTNQTKNKTTIKAKTSKREKRKTKALKRLIKINDAPIERNFSFSALASFIYSLFFIIPIYNFFFGIPALLAGFLSLKKMKENPGAYSGKVFAILGVALATLGILLSIFFIIFAVFLSQFFL